LNAFFMWYKIHTTNSIIGSTVACCARRRPCS